MRRGRRALRTRRWCAAWLLAGVTTAVQAQADATAMPGPYDGAWWATLHCPDTTDRQGTVKGYDWAFPVQVDRGRLEGRYGSEGMPSSLHWTGEVAADGTLEIRADGRSGSTDYAVGRVATGSRYTYTMGGHLDAARGQAARREIRPCAATFVRR